MTNNDRQKFLSAGAILLALALVGFVLFVKPHLNIHLPNHREIPVTSTPQDYKNYEVDVITQINNMRVGVGLRQLTIDPRLTDCAYQRTHTMYKEGWYGHVPPKSTEPAVVTVCGPMQPKATTLGEVLDGDWPSKAVVDWKNSPEHLKILLDPNATNIGFAYTSTGSPTTSLDTEDSQMESGVGIALAVIAVEN